MKIKLVVAFLLVIFVLFFLGKSVPYQKDIKSAPTVSKDALADDDISVSTASTYFLSEQEVKALMVLAYKGNADAAFRLSRFNEYSLEDEGAAIYWLEMAAKSGHGTAQYDMVVTLQHRNDFSDALYWAEILKSRNDPDADCLIDNIKERKNYLNLECLKKSLNRDG